VSQRCRKLARKDPRENEKSGCESKGYLEPRSAKWRERQSKPQERTQSPGQKNKTKAGSVRRMFLSSSETGK
jgi:hypothetical protein